MTHKSASAQFVRDRSVMSSRPPTLRAAEVPSCRLRCPALKRGHWVCRSPQWLSRDWSRRRCRPRWAQTSTRRCSTETRPPTSCVVPASMNIRSPPAARRIPWTQAPSLTNLQNTHVEPYRQSDIWQGNGGICSRHCSILCHWECSQMHHFNSKNPPRVLVAKSPPHWFQPQIPPCL